MYYWVRLYRHHDNDFIQLYLNGVDLSNLFKKCLSAHFSGRALKIEIPPGIHYIDKSCAPRVRVHIDESEDSGITRWFNSFPARYKNHCVKNIARSYLGTDLIDRLNSMSQSGKWKPEAAGVEAETYKPRRRRPRTPGMSGSEWVSSISRKMEDEAEESKKLGEIEERMKNGRLRRTDLEVLEGAEKKGTGGAGKAAEADLRKKAHGASVEKPEMDAETQPPHERKPAAGTRGGTPKELEAIIADSEESETAGRASAEDSSAEGAGTHQEETAGGEDEEFDAFEILASMKS